MIKLVLHGAQCNRSSVYPCTSEVIYVYEIDTSVGITKYSCKLSLAFIMYLKEKELSIYLTAFEHLSRYQAVQSVSPLFSSSAKDMQVLDFRKEISPDFPECAVVQVIFRIFPVSLFSL